jgi:hypothetical protein
MKKLRLVAHAFSLVGICMLLVSYFIYSETKSFIAGASEGNGKVIDLVRSDGTYHPVVEFTSSTGKRIEITSSVGSHPPSYRVGESVTVLYDPSNPHNAQLSGFMDLWFGFLVLVGLGLAFASVGLGMIGVREYRRKKNEWLRRHGRRLKTVFKGVELNSALSVNGRSPYQIVTQSTDDTSNTVRVYQSENIWFDPRDYIKNETIDVLVDPGNPKRYVMDISFLPRLVE